MDVIMEIDFGSVDNMGQGYIISQGGALRR